MGKSVMSTLIGLLIGRGLIELDAPAPVADWHSPGDPRAQITLRHLLNMSSGLRCTGYQEPRGNWTSNLTQPAEVTKAHEEKPRALKSMSDVLSQVSAQSTQEVDVAAIAESDIADRFDVSDGLTDLIDSVRASGQQLPVLLRYRRGAGLRYEVVYGRRRIAA